MSALPASQVVQTQVTSASQHRKQMRRPEHFLAGGNKSEARFRKLPAAARFQIGANNYRKHFTAPAVCEKLLRRRAFFVGENSVLY